MVFNAFKDMLFRKTCFLENSIKSEAYSHCNFMCWSVSDILSFFFFSKNSDSLHPKYEKVNWFKTSSEHFLSLQLSLRLHYPGSACSKEPACNSGDIRRHKFDPWVGKIPWRRAWQPTLVFLPGESHGQRSLVGYSPWGHKELDRAEVT